MTAPDSTLAVGDKVIVRGVFGWFTIAELRLVADEIVVQRGAFRRTVPARDVQRADRGGR